MIGFETKKSTERTQLASRFGCKGTGEHRKSTQPDGKGNQEVVVWESSRTMRSDSLDTLSRSIELLRHQTSLMPRPTLSSASLYKTLQPNARRPWHPRFRFRFFLVTPPVRFLSSFGPRKMACRAWKGRRAETTQRGARLLPRTRTRTDGGAASGT